MSKKNLFVEKFQQQFALLENFQKKRCFDKCPQNYALLKIVRKITLLENF